MVALTLVLVLALAFAASALRGARSARRRDILLIDQRAPPDVERCDYGRPWMVLPSKRKKVLPTTESVDARPPFAAGLQTLVGRRNGRPHRQAAAADPAAAAGVSRAGGIAR